MQLKIILAGPKGSGKSVIANFLAGQSETLISDRYNPTAGVRILEIESKIQGITEDLIIELWDASGDHQYENCWRAIMHEADGVVLVYNPDATSQDQQLSDWFDYFVKRNGLRDEQAMIFAHRTITTTDKFRPPPLFSRVTASLTTPQSGQEMKGMFQTFTRDLFYVKQRK